MNGSEFASRLERVRQSGPSRWTARCPAHDDKSPSLSVAEADDGRLLIKCFAGCGIEAIVGALGISLSDIMPEHPIAQRLRPIRKPIPAADVLEMLGDEVNYVAWAAAYVANGNALNDAERSRLYKAQDLIEIARGKR